MKTKRIVKVIAMLLALCMSLSACGQNFAVEAPEIQNTEQSVQTVQPENSQSVTNLSAGNTAAPKQGTYNEGVVLVKSADPITDQMLSQLNCTSAAPLYEGAQWYLLTLAESADTAESVEYLRQQGCFDAVDYDYIMKTGLVDVSCNPDHKDHDHHHKGHRVPEGWDYMDENNMNPGGSPDVIVAVIDTGVDYNHLDLRNNIWVNPAEIPDNGRDDDGNGYVDDVYGWDCVGNDNDPMDDNGHGTHVAGIIAAENNEHGAVGIAFNCKIMVLKAGDAGGYFNNSDIAEAIQYAYMNGASVINMSFGGENISFAAEEALENAYNSCVLVAAAGNDSSCNSDFCFVHPVVVIYPAALPYVIGVMSCDTSGSWMSGFSNLDHHPYNDTEYEVYACGENVYSTWPGNKYTSLNGTSMAAPVVSAIAALLRSAYPDREMYSTKYIQSQIVNTGTKAPDGVHTVADTYDALNYIPKPDVNLYDYHIDDSPDIAEANNGNGAIDAGETFRLYISLHNRGGVASNVEVSIDVDLGMGITNPYFTIVNPSIQLPDIGTYSVRESGEQYFEIIVDGNCPNNHVVDFNIHFSYANGMDETDTKIYTDYGNQKAQFHVSRGYHLPAVITEDTVYTADRLYIVGEDLVIPQGVTITFEKGCEIQFYDDRDYYNSPMIINYGTLIFEGTKDANISIFPSDQYYTYVCAIKNYGVFYANYVETVNLFAFAADKDAAMTIDNSMLRQQLVGYAGGSYKDSILCISNGGKYWIADQGSVFNEGNIIHPKNYSIFNSYVEAHGGQLDTYYAVTSFENCALHLRTGKSAWVTLDAESINTVIYSAYYRSAEFAMEFQLSKMENNLVIDDIRDSRSVITFRFLDPSQVSNNSFSATYQKHASQLISGYYDSTGHPIIDVYGSLADASLLWPHVVSVEMIDKDGNPITRVGKEEIKVRVTFNRPMDVNAGTFLTFGTIEPYADYKIEGSYISDTVWEGTYTLRAEIENGQNYLKVNNACAAEDQTKTVFGEYQLHEFTIDTTAAMSMNLQATPTENGINLTWFQDDYDTLLGYNIYRSEEKDGYYTKLNPAILLPSDESFLDENAEPGKTYWYTYTVVLTDFTESNPAGKVMATAMDTISPNIYHTPVNQGCADNNLVISCTASDNIAISTVTLYYRAAGATAWKSLNMSKQNDKYSATIFGSDVTMAGLEYYIVAIDGGGNAVANGSAETPYTVVVKDASAISRLGDVNGDGTVTTKDALMIMQAINGDQLLADDEFKRADLNKDGILSSMEALRILQYINGNVTTLEM